MNNWLFTKKNFILFGLSAVLLAVGYVLLGLGPAITDLMNRILAWLAVDYVLLGQSPVENHLSKSVAPVILVAVYCGLIPYAILCGGGKDVKK